MIKVSMLFISITIDYKEDEALLCNVMKKTGL